ncbi:MAG: sugar ABC transporter permease [Defluviitaleaceae bacterium]|nr:sugar ABC transporter permease [Defluviitaleaceae bacterium]MCL2238893.1 sugar ABC transporter permease [Defluviitaleaceae bacterium]
MHSGKGSKNAVKSWTALFPALLFIGLIILFPIGYTAYISLTNMNIFNWFDFRIIGFGNYRRALFVFNSGFLRALVVTVLWTALNMVFQLAIAFVMASLLNVRKLRLRRVYKTVLMFPWAMPGYVSILLWRHGMFNAQFGLVNQWLYTLGMEPRRWLADDFSAFVICMVVNLWLALPFMIMIMDGALQSLDKSYYESALIDGAGWFTRSVRLTIPAIRPIIAPAVIITLFTTFKQFDVIYLMTKQIGARTGANIHTVLTYAYESAFVTRNYGYSSAVSISIFVMLIGFSVLVAFLRRRGQKA